MKDYHCCATCSHFQVIKIPGRVYYKCRRLGFETRPDYKFNCWEPKAHVKSLMKKEQENA
nr:hypothetical protein [Alteribacter salitolerans]